MNNAIDTQLLNLISEMLDNLVVQTPPFAAARDKLKGKYGI